MSSPQAGKMNICKTPRSAKTLDVLLRKRPGAPKRSMYLGNAGLISGLMFNYRASCSIVFNCIQSCSIVFTFLMSGASSYPTLTTKVSIFTFVFINTHKFVVYIYAPGLVFIQNCWTFVYFVYFPSALLLIKQEKLLFG